MRAIPILSLLIAPLLGHGPGGATLQASSDPFSVSFREARGDVVWIGLTNQTLKAAALCVAQATWFRGNDSITMGGYVFDAEPCVIAQQWVLTLPGQTYFFAREMQAPAGVQGRDDFKLQVTFLAGDEGSFLQTNERHVIGLDTWFVRR